MNEAQRDIERFENRHSSNKQINNQDQLLSEYDHLKIPINYWDNIE
ncbi:hypothetical protein ACF3NG_05160 [Aerococcaceae bacterium WGS1372]